MKRQPPKDPPKLSVVPPGAPVAGAPTTPAAPATPGADPPKRKVIGRPFKKGQSGNPGGKPKIHREIVELARSHCVEAIEKLVKLMHHRSPTVALKACVAILERAYGKPSLIADPAGNEPGRIARRVILSEDAITIETVEGTTVATVAGTAGGDSGTADDDAADATDDEHDSPDSQ